MNEATAAILGAVVAVILAVALEIIRRRAERFEKDLKGLSTREAQHHERTYKLFLELRDEMMCADDGNPESRRERLKRVK